MDDAEQLRERLRDQRSAVADLIHAVPNWIVEDDVKVCCWKHPSTRPTLIRLTRELNALNDQITALTRTIWSEGKITP